MKVEIIARERLYRKPKSKETGVVNVALTPDVFIFGEGKRYDLKDKKQVDSIEDTNTAIKECIGYNPEDMVHEMLYYSSNEVHGVVYYFPRTWGLFLDVYDEADNLVTSGFRFQCDSLDMESICSEVEHLLANGIKLVS